VAEGIREVAFNHHRTRAGNRDEVHGLVEGAIDESAELGRDVIIDAVALRMAGMVDMVSGAI
jgi:hypothetical protein